MQSEWNIQDIDIYRYFMLAFLEANKLIICSTIVKIWGLKCQTAFNRICFHWPINFRPQASDPKNTYTTSLCGYNRSVFNKSEFESITPKSSALPAIVWSFWPIWYSGSVYFLKMTYIFIHSGLFNVCFWDLKAEFYYRNWRPCRKL